MNASSSDAPLPDHAPLHRRAPLLLRSAAWRLGLAAGLGVVLWLLWAWAT
ncbi:MAG: hypothetical protein Q4G71_13810 [Pseudomonadota bacterium]|nr:hypothetical protein [Pseudomonadota bacterium]